MVSHWEQGFLLFSCPSEFWPHLVCLLGCVPEAPWHCSSSCIRLHSGISESAPLLPLGDFKTPLCSMAHIGVPSRFPGCLTAAHGTCCWDHSVVACNPHLRQLSDGNQSMNTASFPPGFPSAAHSSPSGVAVWSGSGAQGACR